MIGIVWVDLAHVPADLKWNICRYVLAGYHIALFAASGSGIEPQEVRSEGERERMGERGGKSEIERERRKNQG